MMQTATLISHVLLWLLVLGLGVLLLGSLRAQGLLSWRLAQLEATTPSRIGRSGLKPGKKAPDFTLPSVAGGDLSLVDFAGRKVLLVFVQSGCGPCYDVAPALNRLAAANSELQVLVVNNATPDDTREYAHVVEAKFPVLVQQKWSVSKRYEVFATPFAFLIDERGIVAAKGIVSSKEYLGFLLSSTASPTTANGSGGFEDVGAEINGERGEVREPLSLSPREVRHV